MNDSAHTIPALLVETAARRGGELALGTIRAGELRWRSWREVASDAAQMAAEMRSAGIAPGDRGFVAGSAKRRAGEVRESSSALRRGDFRAARQGDRKIVTQAGTHLLDACPGCRRVVAPACDRPGPPSHSSTDATVQQVAYQTRLDVGTNRFLRFKLFHRQTLRDECRRAKRLPQRPIPLSRM